MTLEGVRGAEYYTFKGAEPPSPTHNCTLPFTRNVVGPMDYTPVTFTIRNENPRKTTYAHELALPIIFESGWVVMADRPGAYLGSPAKTMLQQMKATWNETKYIDGYPGEFVCLARRNDKDWFLAAINGSEEREIEIPLNFIKNGQYGITIYTDNPDKPLTDIDILSKKIRSDETLKIKLIKNGGFCTIIKDSFKE
jgi:alpha-glucosidase